MRGHQHCINCLRESAGLYNYPCVECGWSPEQHVTSGLYLSPGTILHGQYQIARMLGHGGFGITYLAWNNLLEIKLAIKEYMPRDFATRNTTNSEISTFAGDAKESFAYGLERFLDEARTLAKFQQHSGIVSVLNVFYGNGTGYMVMEYIDGLTLKEYLLDKGKLSWEQTLHLFMPVMDALRAVHKAGMLHRDISPDNIYLCQDNRIKLLDFGSARFALGGHSRSLSVVVKPGYAPEEQYRTKGKQGSWTDVYSVAASMYRCITGLVPPEALDRLDEDELIKPSLLGVKISDLAEKALMSALAIKAENRTQTIEALQKYLTGSGNIIDEQIVVKPYSKNDFQKEEEAVTIVPINESIPVQSDVENNHKDLGLPKIRDYGFIWWFIIILILVVLYLNFGSKDSTNENTPASVQSNQQQTISTPITNLSLTDTINLAKKYDNAKDYKQSFTWFSKAADQGDAYSQFKIGLMYYGGNGVEKDLEKSIFWYKKSAYQGSHFAQTNLGYLYQRGELIDQSYSEAYKWFKLAADQNDPLAENFLGLLYYDGKGVIQDYKEAFKWFHKAADQGHKDSQNNLGHLYYDGKGVIQDYKEAFKWFHKAADQGVTVAQVSLGWYYMNGDGNLEDNSIDYKKAIYWNQKAADNGESEAFNNLGWLYEHALGVDKNLVRAAELYQTAVRLGTKNGAGKQNIQEAKSRLSKVNALIKANAAQEQQDDTINAEDQIRLANEFYSKKNYKEAIAWYRKAADQGNIAGEYNLGILYEKGLGEKTDLTQAIYWYQKAANQNDKDAYKHLTNAQIKLAGQFYQAKNYKEAISLYRGLAEQGNPVGQYNLGILYEKGLGVPTDVEQAKIWFQKAADQGDADAIDKIKANTLSQKSFQQDNLIDNEQQPHLYKTGDRLHNGGVVFYVDFSGLHGLSAKSADSSQATAWEDGLKIVRDLGNGWRLPNKQELSLLYNQKDIVGGFSKKGYWSTSETVRNDSGVWAQSFEDGTQYYSDKISTRFVRAILAF